MSAQRQLGNEYRIPERMKAWVLGGPEEIRLAEKPALEPAARSRRNLAGLPSQ